MAVERKLEHLDLLGMKERPRMALRFPGFSSLVDDGDILLMGRKLGYGLCVCWNESSWNTLDLRQML